MNGNNVIYYDSFIVEHITEETKKLIGDRNIIKTICRIQAYVSIRCRYFCIGFTDFMLKSKSLLDNTTLLSPSGDGNNDKIILKYFNN